MKTEFIEKYAHGWRVFERLVKDFDAEAWLHTGRKTITPVRLSFHILQSAKYFLEDPTVILFASGKPFECDWETAREADLPSQADVLACIPELQAKAEKWLSEMDFSAENKSFEWAGKTKLDVALFMLHHSFYHLGELSSLLNESRNGEAEDNYVKAL